MAYNIYDRKFSKVLPPAVTITAAGRISLNAPLTRMFYKRAIKSILLLSDIEGRKIALRPITKQDKRSYAMSYGPDLCQVSMSAKGFLNDIGWDGKVYNIPARWDEKVSILEFQMPMWGVGKAPSKGAVGKEKTTLQIPKTG